MASQEYAKSVDLKALSEGIPVVTASFPGPAIHAKTARGESELCSRRLTNIHSAREYTVLVKKQAQCS